MLQIANLNLGFDSRRLFRDLTLRLNPGEICCVKGPNGSGKSSFLNCLSGIIPNHVKAEFSASLRLYDTELSTLPLCEKYRYLWHAQSDPSTQFFFPTLEAELAFALENKGLTTAEMQTRVDEALATFNLNPCRYQPSSELSYGQQKLLLCAIGEALDPQLFLLDEPMAGLSETSQLLVLNWLKNLKSRGKIIVLAEHDSSVDILADRVLSLDPSADRGGEIPSPQQAQFSVKTSYSIDSAKSEFGSTEITPSLHSCSLYPHSCSLYPHSCSLYPHSCSLYPHSCSLYPHSCESRNLLQQKEIPDQVRNTQKTAPLFQTNDLHFAYPRSRELFSGFNLRIDSTDNILLRGENGSGKSTLLKLLSGLLRPISGEVLIAGKPHKGLTAANFKHFYYQGQATSDSLLGISPEQNWSMWKLALPALPDYPHSFDPLFSELSSGQQKQAAQSILPYLIDKFWILDEPFNALDETASRELLTLLEHKIKYHPGLLLVAHTGYADQLPFDRILKLQAGGLQPCNPDLNEALTRESKNEA